MKFTDFKTFIRHFNLKWPKFEEFLIIWGVWYIFDPTPLVERIEMVKWERWKEITDLARIYTPAMTFGFLTKPQVNDIPVSLL